MTSTNENGGREDGGREDDRRSRETTGESQSASCPGSGVRAYPFGVVQGLELHPMYGYARENEPLCRIRMPYGDEAWLVTRYDDFKTVVGDARFCRVAADNRDEPRMTPYVIPGGLIDMDPPDHTRVRGLVAKALGARQVERLRPRVEQVADELVTAMLAAGPQADLVRSLALPLTNIISCELLGVPPADRHRLETWFEGISSTTSPAENQLGEGLASFMAFTSDLLAQRRRQPSDDLLDALIRANEEEGRLSDDELVFLTLLMLGGGSQTMNEIGNFAYLLLTHPDQWALLCRRPELIDGALEELLRFTPLAPVSGIPRYATVDVQLSGGTVRAGEPVFAFHAAANRDPRAFPDPDRLDVTRPVSPNVAFGHGAHYCIGAPIARLELRVVFATLLARVPGLRLAVDPGEITWDVGPVARGPRALPVTW
jgi:cytochrome P450